MGITILQIVISQIETAYETDDYYPQDSAELAEIHGNPDQMKILMDQGHPEHQALQDKVTALQKVAYPGT